MTAPLPLTAAPPIVSLPPNITPVATYADIITRGVRLLRFTQVADEAEAVEAAGCEYAYLLRSKVLPCYYLIFPVAVVTEYVERKAR